MRKLFITILMTGITVMSFGQTKVIKGAVIDMNGNPLPGAKIEATGGAENTVTDVDGTFSIEVSQWLKSLSVTYPGMDKQKKKIKQDNRDMIFTMKEASKFWFITAVGNYECTNSIPGAGVMFGRLGKWGWYGKALMDFYAAEHHRDKAMPSFSVGVIKRITKPFYVYLGAGWTGAVYEYEEYSKYNPYYDYDEYYHDWCREDGIIIDLGFLYRAKKVNFNIGCSIRNHNLAFQGDWGLSQSIQLGVGYTF